VAMYGFTTTQYVTATESSVEQDAEESIYLELMYNRSLSSMSTAPPSITSVAKVWVSISPNGLDVRVKLDPTAATDPSKLAALTQSVMDSISKDRQPQCSNSYWYGVNHPQSITWNPKTGPPPENSLVHDGGPNNMLYFCCGYCTILVDNVSVFYWPTATAKTDCLTLNATNTIDFYPGKPAHFGQGIHSITQPAHSRHGRALPQAQNFSIGDIATGPDGFT